MIVLGMDPGTARVGFALVQREGSALCALDYGLIGTSEACLATRLRAIHEQTHELISRHRPDLMSLERLLFSVNKKTALDVARSLGVIALAAAQHDLPIFEYTPPEVKLAVVGYGGADKKQVQFMVTKLLRLTEIPTPDDVADALAIALTHALRGPSVASIAARG